MMAENKKKHQGQYKNPSGNDYNSTMKKFVPFDYKKLANADQKGSNTKDYGASPFIIRHFGSPEAVPFVPKAERTGRDITQPVEGETEEQRAARLQQKAEELAKLAKDLLENAPKRRKVSEFLTAKVKSIKAKSKFVKVEPKFEMILRMTQIPVNAPHTEVGFGMTFPFTDDREYVRTHARELGEEGISARSLLKELDDYHSSKLHFTNPRYRSDENRNREILNEVFLRNSDRPLYNEWLKTPKAKSIVREMRIKYNDYNKELNAKRAEYFKKEDEKYWAKEKRKEQWKEEWEEYKKWEAERQNRPSFIYGQAAEGKKWEEYLLNHINGTDFTDKKNPYRPVPYVQFSAKPSAEILRLPTPYTPKQLETKASKFRALVEADRKTTENLKEEDIRKHFDFVKIKKSEYWKSKKTNVYYPYEGEYDTSFTNYPRGLLDTDTFYNPDD